MPFEACKRQVLTKSTVSVITDWGQIKLKLTELGENDETKMHILYLESLSVPSVSHIWGSLLCSPSAVCRWSEGHACEWPHHHQMDLKLHNVVNL